MLASSDTCQCCLYVTQVQRIIEYGRINTHFTVPSTCVINIWLIILTIINKQELLSQQEGRTETAYFKFLTSVASWELKVNKKNKGINK